MIEKKDVEYIAGLARLGITREEEKLFQKELSVVLDYLKKLKEVDISRIEPSNRAIESGNVTREDKAEDCPFKEEIIKMFPEREKRFLKVKSVKDLNS